MNRCSYLSTSSYEHAWHRNGDDSLDSQPASKCNADWSWVLDSTKCDVHHVIASIPPQHTWLDENKTPTPESAIVYGSATGDYRPPAIHEPDLVALWDAPSVISPFWWDRSSSTSSSNIDAINNNVINTNERKCDPEVRLRISTAPYHSLQPTVLQLLSRDKGSPLLVSRLIHTTCAPWHGWSGQVFDQYIGRRKTR